MGRAARPAGLRSRNVSIRSEAMLGGCSGQWRYARLPAWLDSLDLAYPVRSRSRLFRGLTPRLAITIVRGVREGFPQMAGNTGYAAPLLGLCTALLSRCPY